MNENQEQEPMIEEQSLPTLSIKEAELPVVNATDVKEIRVVNNMDESRSVSIVEARKALAVNPSTTEQATGETWDGKPVYVRELKGLFPADSDTMILLEGIRSLNIRTGSISGYSAGWNLSNPNFNDKYYWSSRVADNSIAIELFNASITQLMGKPYYFILEYTKL